MFPFLREGVGKQGECEWKMQNILAVAQYIYIYIYIYIYMYTVYSIPYTFISATSRRLIAAANIQRGLYCFLAIELFD
jgi:hypothetical protein